MANFCQIWSHCASKSWLQNADLGEQRREKVSGPNLKTLKSQSVADFQQGCQMVYFYTKNTNFDIF
jgi:hypothetical protein